MSEGSVNLHTGQWKLSNLKNRGKEDGEEKSQHNNFLLDNIKQFNVLVIGVLEEKEGMVQKIIWKNTG